MTPLDQDLLKWKVRPYRRLLTTKHRYGFRFATQLDPLDCILFTALVYEIGLDIENHRIGKEYQVCYSNRFIPDKDGDMYDKEFNWNEFQKRSEEIIREMEASYDVCEYVIIADIADFFQKSIHIV